MLSRLGQVLCCMAICAIINTACERLSSPAEVSATEHALIVHFSYGSTDLTRLFALEDELEAAITSANVGEFDGNEIAVDGSDGYLFMYGPSADLLFEVVEPILKMTDFMNGATVRRQYGPPEDGTREVSTTITLEPN